ncbi:MAG TPA: hypothetical protein VI522_00065 [Gammaproteobacteria bacterium]|nr:hypothetical protein [Gammaproteobacteria bacterium]
MIDQATISALFSLLENKVDEIKRIQICIDEAQHLLQVLPNCPIRQAFYDSINIIHEAAHTLITQKNAIYLQAKTQNRELYPYEQELITSFEAKYQNNRRLAAEKQLEINQMRAGQVLLIEQNKQILRSGLEKFERGICDYAANVTGIFKILLQTQIAVDVPAFTIVEHGALAAPYFLPLVTFLLNESNANHVKNAYSNSTSSCRNQQ